MAAPDHGGHRPAGRGRPAHTADPLANDQDWHLVLWLRAQAQAGDQVG
ncbi:MULTISPECIES: hypothetical protein [Streptomyces]